MKSQARELILTLDSIAASLGLSLSQEEATKLNDYVALLLRWNTTYNLTAVRDPAGVLVQHLADCLAIVGPLQRAWPDDAGSKLVDVGSGGGLPGVVLATLMPNRAVTCVDAVGKKTAFIRQVAGALRLPNLHAAHSRIEALAPLEAAVIVSRAFSSLGDFVTLSARHLKPGGIWVAMKGKLPDAEIATLPAHIEVFHVEQLTVPGLEADRCLVWMRNLSAA